MIGSNRLKNLALKFREDLEFMTYTDDISSEVFADAEDAKSHQLHEIFGMDFIERAEKVFDEEHLNTIQNVIDNFYNLVNLRQ